MFFSTRKKKKKSDLDALHWIRFCFFFKADFLSPYIWGGVGGVGGCEEKKETTLVLCCGFPQCLNVKIKFLSLGVDNVWLV